MKQYSETTPSRPRRILGIILLSAPLLGPLFLLLLFIYAASVGDAQRAGYAGLAFVFFWGVGSLVLFPMALLGTVLALRKGVRIFFLFAFPICAASIYASVFVYPRENLFHLMTFLTALLCFAAVYCAFTSSPKVSAVARTIEGEEPSVEEQMTVSSAPH